jgi:SAM-dependent methyltransferase
VRVEVATFERWDPAGRRFDLLISGQAWHWVDPHAGAAKAAAVLRPRGRIGVFWNFGRPDPPLRVAIAVRYRRHEPELEERPVPLRHGNDPVGAAAAGLDATRRFERAAVRRWRWRRAYTTEQWLELLATHSDHLALPPRRRARLFEAVGAEIDRFGGSAPVTYTTALVTARRR